MLLELAAFLDGYDVAVAKQSGLAANAEKLAVIRQSLQVLCGTASDAPRVEQLLELLATI